MKPSFVRFCELKSSHVNRDLQVHTIATDGKATIQEMIQQAQELGLEEIAFTEHVRRTSGYYQDFVKEVGRARQGIPLRVYVGLEAKVLDERGALDVSLSHLTQAELVLGSIHRFPINAKEFVAAKFFDYQEAAEREYLLSRSLLQNAPIDVLAHPGGMCLRAFGQFPADYFKELMRISLDRGIAIEINTSYTKDLEVFVGLCREINPFVSVGSDAHTIEELGTCRDSLRRMGVGCP